MNYLEAQIRDGIDQDMTDSEIAEWLDIPVSWVHEAIEAMYQDEQDDYDDSMDGDHDSAMQSAGWGTDEDYGGEIEEY